MKIKKILAATLAATMVMASALTVCATTTGSGGAGSTGGSGGSTTVATEEIKSAKEKLMTSAQALFAKVYEQAQGAQGAGPDMGAGFNGGADMGGQSNSYQDDVVDGDYREV